MEVVELCKKYREDGVVAIDLAGDESLNTQANPEHREAYMVSGIDNMLRNVGFLHARDNLSCYTITDVSEDKQGREIVSI